MGFMHSRFSYMQGLEFRNLDRAMSSLLARRNLDEAIENAFCSS